MLSVLVKFIGLFKPFFSERCPPVSLSAEVSRLDVHAQNDSDSFKLVISTERFYEGYNAADRTAMEVVKKSFVKQHSGFCVICDQQRNFYTDYRHAYVTNQGCIPNWRERMVCLHCLLNNRQRAAYHLLLQCCKPSLDSCIYITEQTTPYYKMLHSAFPGTVGSEYLGDKRRPGVVIRGIRHEDLTGLSFRDECFDILLSYDVLEHIPDYASAIAEMFRVLKPGGQIMLSVPFNRNRYDNLVRARLEVDGSITHLEEPEYHGNPVKLLQGSLCFYHFGWQLLDDLRVAGFGDVSLLMYWSRQYCYLGGEQLILYARKPVT